MYGWGTSDLCGKRLWGRETSGHRLDLIRLIQLSQGDYKKSESASSGRKQGSQSQPTNEDKNTDDPTPSSETPSLETVGEY